MGLSSRQCLSNVPNSFILVLLLFHVLGASSLYSRQQQTPTCHGEESSALLQFKQSFIIDPSASSADGSYPKVSSWKAAEGQQNSNCCSWDGVECDEETGHVIGLDLSSSCLYGFINSSSTLFRLIHLQRLNLADNHFNYSQIPTTIRKFPRLRYLDLSHSVFSGEVPSEVSQLSKLSTLDLSVNLDTFTGETLLKLNASTMRRLVQNLTSLQKLHLSFINISSPVPHSLANLSFLTSLLLRDCGISGEFPLRIFKLQSLKTLSVRFNQDLVGHVPEFNRSSPLVSLGLASTSFSGSLPSSIEKLDSLNVLDISACSFSGMIPFSVGNLKQLNYLGLSKNRFTGPVPASLANLTQLTYLSLSYNNLSAGSLSWVGKQTKLALLELDRINLSGYIPSSLSNLTELNYLYLRSNELTGPIPSSLGNLSRLVGIKLFQNKFYGPIPESFYNFINLQTLELDRNSLSGVVEFDGFLKLQNVNEIVLSDNKLKLLTQSRSPNVSVPQLSTLGLRSCSIREFPDFLRYQQKLQWLDLGGNNLHGQVPKWMWNTSTETLQSLLIEGNFLSGFGQPQADQHLVVLPWLNLRLLSFVNNSLQGPLPIPPPCIEIYYASDNKLSGEISPLICSLTSIQLLDLSNNKLSGMLPQCLGYFSDYLQVLRLGNNSFQGILPQVYSQRSILKMIDVSHNQLQGKLPRSLADCVMLEFLVLSNNDFSDVFPFWLGTLPELKVLALRNNDFHGVLGKPEYSRGFSQLRIFDLSYNNFTGELLIDYIFSENAMMRVDISVNRSTYMRANVNSEGSGINIYIGFAYSMSIAVKGLELYYPKIQEAFAVIDISSNRFEGRIHEFIGNLKGLRSLNISNNIFTGSIPSFLGNLTLLESLDVSQNKLSGEIPQQLVQLTFLAKFNVSHNNLTGPIPHGTQLTSFDITSYEGNSGLCGDPLPEKCGNPSLPPSSVEDNDPIEFDWKFVVAGFGSGLVVGVVLADLFITRFREWFIEIVGMITPMKRRRQRRN
ncbi:receptor-like protein 7 [Rosa rugosa]|uniref:receptor-like protein 7 n=1 Tax=Rosa rugosa TaxID=74645 RepID=UPI002B4078A5|nr:receptor-like protein 7 [Rosa rugosa]